MKIKSVMFFSNGNTAVFDTRGEQIGELQESWMLKFIEALPKEYIESYEQLDILLPHGKKAKLFKIEGGFNWDILEPLTGR